MVLYTEIFLDNLFFVTNGIESAWHMRVHNYTCELCIMEVLGVSLPRHIKCQSTHNFYSDLFTMEVLGCEGENTLVSVSLPDATNQILGMLEAGQDQNGLMIYWVHGLNIFMFLYPGDQNYRVEMRRLRRELHKLDGNASEIVAGEPLQVGSHILYPIDVRMPGRPCYPYFLLRQDGQFDHSNYTPYLFRTAEKRDELLQWLNQIDE